MAIETNELIDVKTLPPFKRFIMTIGNLPTSYLESMSYAELVMWFCNYLQETVIPAVNNNGEAVEELQNLYEELYSYINNLDLQEEVNNKLDEMVESGELGSIINSYLTPYEEELNATVQSIDNKVSNLHQDLSLNRDMLIKKKIIAHRGCDNLAPENSIPAFEYVAKVGGYWGCETDVQRTYDGKFIIMHDLTVDRTTNGTGTVSEMLYSTIQNLIIDTGAYISDYPNLKIPTLSEYLTIMKKYGIVPVIEIKVDWNTEILEELIDEIKTNGLLYNTLFVSYVRNVCTRLQNIDGNLNVALLVDSYDSETENYVISNNLNLFINGSIITEEIVQTMHSHNLKVGRFIDFNDITSADYLMCADITRLLYKDTYYQSVPISPWDKEQLERYGNSFNGQVLTLLRKGHTSEANYFPDYFQSSNNVMAICYNTIKSNPDMLFHFNIPVGYDMKVWQFKYDGTQPGSVDWVTGDGADHDNVNITYLFKGIIVLAFRRSDLEPINYKDMEILRKSVNVWYTKKN